MNRRALLALAPAAILAACVAPGSAGGITIAQAQAESNAIVAALQAGQQVYESSPGPSAAELAAVNNAVQGALAANATLQGAIAQSSWQGAVESVSQSVSATLAVMPIDPATRAAIDAGLAVIDAFLEQPVNAPASVKLGGALHGTAEAPVPIPLPRPNARRVL